MGFTVERDEVRDAEIRSEAEQDPVPVTVAKMTFAYLKPLYGILITLCLAWISLLGVLVSQHTGLLTKDGKPGIEYSAIDFVPVLDETTKDVTVTVMLPKVTNGATFVSADFYLREQGRNATIISKVTDATLLGTEVSFVVESAKLSRSKYHDFYILYRVGTPDGARTFKVHNITGGYRYP